MLEEAIRYNPSDLLYKKPQLDTNYNHSDNSLTGTNNNCNKVKQKSSSKPNATSSAKTNRAKNPNKTGDSAQTGLLNPAESINSTGVADFNSSHLSQYSMEQQQQFQYQYHYQQQQQQKSNSLISFVTFEGNKNKSFI